MGPVKGPIGVFDSGVGGLTVLQALQRAMPGQDFIYFGDTARVPYGSKPPDMVARFAWEISGYLLRQGAQALVIACNTASAVAYPTLAHHLSVPVYSVLEPAVAEARAHGGRIGLIGTAVTVASEAYQRHLPHLWAQACPLFVPIVEEGLWADGVAHLVAAHYLKEAPPLDALILGCTHYPLLKPVLAELLPGVRLIDSAEALAKVVASDLGPPYGSGQTRHLVTGDPEAYALLARRLNVEVTHVERVSLEEL
jgi:glutamate racemase